MTKHASRYQQVSRRALLKGSLGLGAVALVPGLACGSSNDSDVFAGASAAQSEPTAIQTTAPTPEPVAESPTQVPTATAAEPTAEPLATVSTEPTAAPEADPPAPPAALTALPAGAMMAIDFSYVQASGGKNLPPYVAVWLEDSNGELVETIVLWYEQSRKGDRWLPDLKRWFSVDQKRISSGGANLVDVISSATRIAGSYSIGWDGQIDGVAAPAGDYFLCIEAARERGPYSLIREPIVLNGVMFEMPLAATGELQAASVAVRV